MLVLELPRMRQWWLFNPIAKENVLVREKNDRVASWNELFYDVIYVANIAKLSM